MMSYSTRQGILSVGVIRLQPTDAEPCAVRAEGRRHTVRDQPRNSTFVII